MFFKSTDTKSPTADISEQSISFTYDNTVPVDTSCGTDLLDEPTRPYYYLTSNVGNCSVTASTTLRGSNGGNYYTTSNITGTTGVNIILQNTTATGTISAFNNITVSSSTLSGVITVNGTFSADTLSRFSGTTTIASGGTLTSGVFTGDLINNGTITSSTTTPTTVAGKVTNTGTINGNFAFASTTSTNTGTINGNLTLSTLSAVQGEVTFTGSTAFLGTGSVTGNIKDTSGNNITRFVFNDSSTNSGYTKGNAIFNNTSSNALGGTVQGNAYFNASSTNLGSVTGTADVYAFTTPLTGTVTGATTYHGYPNTISFNNTAGDNDWSNSANWFTDATRVVTLGRIPTDSESVVLFASTTLSENVTNTIYIASNDVILDGGGTAGENVHTLTGSVSGNGSYAGGDAFDFTLANITVTGTTTANGGDGTADVDGGKGGDITIATSSTWVLSANGGDPEQNGGDAGIITVTNSSAVEYGTLILANGGNSVGCGYGGSGGDVFIIDSFGYEVLSNIKGSDATSSCTPTHGTQGHDGTKQVTGIYYHATPAHLAQPAAITPSRAVIAVNIPFVFNKGNTISVPVASVKPLVFKPLPVFGGTGKTGFSFESAIGNFLFKPLSSFITNSLKSAPQLNNYLISSGLSTSQDLLLLKNKPFPLIIPLKNVDIPDGLLMLSVNDTPIPLYAAYDSRYFLVEKATVTAGSTFTISLFPTTKGVVTASFNESKYTLKKAGKTTLLSADIIAPLATTTNTYTISVTGAPLPLVITVVPPKTTTPIEKVKKQSVWNVLKFW
jgi:hypothetical protein